MGRFRRWRRAARAPKEDAMPALLPPGEVPRRRSQAGRFRLPRLRGVAAAILLTFGPTGAWAAEDAMQLLKRTSDYLASQQSIALTFDSDIEVMTPTLQKLQFASSGEALINRPDKLRIGRTGGYADVELVFDGRKVTIFGKDLNAYAQADFTGTLDALIDKLRADLGIEAPGADLLLSKMFNELGPEVIKADHIGQGVIDGVDCEHLAFRNTEVDWQLWIESGPNPIPRKYVITSKTLTGAPQYTLRIKSWKTGMPMEASAFAFKPPAEAKRVEFKELPGLDEVPPGTPEGPTK